MKLNNLTKLTLLAAASLALLAPAAHAATTNASEGDLILAFRATGGTGAGTNLEVDLGRIIFNGSAIVYTAPGGSPVTLTGGQVINMSGANGLSVSDLNANYGPSLSWNTRSDLLWSVTSTAYNNGQSLSLPDYTMWATSKSNSLGLRSVSDQTSPAGYVDTMIGAFSQKTSTPNSNVSYTLPSTQGGSYSVEWATENGAGNDFGFTSQSKVPGRLENDTNINSGSFVFSELYQLNPAPGSSSVAGKDLGTFKLTDQGVLTFTAVSVPEPSTYAMLAAGAAGLLVLRRRRQSTKA